MSSTFVSLGCSGHIVKLKFLPESKKDIKVSVLDDVMETRRKIFFKTGFDNSEDVELYSLSSNPELHYEFLEADHTGLDILYSCQKNR